jgi:thiol:disulfide interchange protein DsbD
VYFLRPLIGETWFRYGVAASLLVGAIFLFFKTGRSQQARALRIACAAILLTVGVAFAIPRTTDASGLTWQQYEQANVLAASQRQPVVIDFFADWCIPCKELDAKTFSDKAVAQELGRFKRVKADLTLPDDPKTRELTQRYHIVGVPTIVFLDSNGQEIESLRLTGFEEPEKFLARARQAR